MYWNIKHKILLFKNCERTVIFQISFALNTQFHSKKYTIKCQNCILEDVLDRWLSKNCFLRLSVKVYPVSCFFNNTWKFQKRPCSARKIIHPLMNTNLMKLNCYLVQNLYPNTKYEIVFFENCKNSHFFHLHFSKYLI